MSSPACAWNCRSCSSTRTGWCSSFCVTASLDGLRIDHVDGLLDPKGYLLRLRERAPRPFYLGLRRSSPDTNRCVRTGRCHGTTGYEFANLVLGLLVDPAGEEAFTRFYIDFTGKTDSFRRPSCATAKSVSCTTRWPAS